jgi:hypothetical protein
MIIERDADYERDIIELKRKLNTEVKGIWKQAGSKSQERKLVKSAMLLDVPNSVGFESNCSFVYHPQMDDQYTTKKAKLTAGAPISLRIPNTVIS